MGVDYGPRLHRYSVPEYLEREMRNLRSMQKCIEVQVQSEVVNAVSFGLSGQSPALGGALSLEWVCG